MICQPLETINQTAQYLPMDITISWTNPASGAGGTPDHYDIYRATGDLTPEYNTAGDDLGSGWTKLTAIRATHTSFDAATQVTDSTAEAATTYTYAVLAFNTAGYGLPANASDVPHQSVTA